MEPTDVETIDYFLNFNVMNLLDLWNPSQLRSRAGRVPGAPGRLHENKGCQGKIQGVRVEPGFIPGDDFGLFQLTDSLENSRRNHSDMAPNIGVGKVSVLLKRGQYEQINVVKAQLHLRRRTFCSGGVILRRRMDAFGHS